MYPGLPWFIDSPHPPIISPTLCPPAQGKEPLLPKSTVNQMFEHAHFLFNLKGRALFFVIIGCLITAASPWLNVFVGIYVLAMGGISFFYSFKVTKKLDAQLKSGNVTLDLSGYGSKLSPVDFVAYLKTQGIELSAQEAEAAVYMFDTDGDQTVDVLAFIKWQSSE